MVSSSTGRSALRGHSRVRIANKSSGLIKSLAAEQGFSVIDTLDPTPLRDHNELPVRWSGSRLGIPTGGMQCSVRSKDMLLLYQKQYCC